MPTGASSNEPAYRVVEKASANSERPRSSTPHATASPTRTQHGTTKTAEAMPSCAWRVPVPTSGAR
jgi:hypothetical protein